MIHAKRTQFAPGPAGTRPEGRATGAKRAKRTQFGRRCRAGRGQSGVGRGGKCAKRTQFAWSARAPEAEMRKTNPIWEKCQASSLKLGTLSCETNPICAGAGWDEAGGASDEGKTCETNPISEGVSDWKCRASGESCKTNPICGGGDGMRFGVSGFEPPTSWSQTKRSGQAELHPVTMKGNVRHIIWPPPAPCNN